MSVTVSVIMPAYNAAGTLKSTLDSLRAQTFSDWELVLVDDGSRDGTLALAKEMAEADPRIRIFENEANKGVTYTRARAADLARGEWIAILDSDDQWAPDKLEKQLKKAAETGAELIYTGSAFMDEAGRPLDYYLAAPGTISLKQLLKQNLISNSSVLVKAALYRTYMVRESARPIHEDFACWIAMLKNGVAAAGIDEPLLIYRVAAGSKSGNKKKAAVMNWNTYRLAGLNPVTAAYYMVWYVVKGLLKYRHLR
ncbi:MAG: glycosyltransferase [Lachnospiraceae bacterium]|nr:glycosyltransferase [Lachnospiraceae bacterium]